MRFVLNQELIEVESKQIDINISLLRYLREIKHLYGTKEGCASGDCGACTVLVGQQVGGPSATSFQIDSQAKTESSNAIDYQSVNACILPLYAVDGCHIVTIELLTQIQAFPAKNSTQNISPPLYPSQLYPSQLYPSQQAMVDCHASQCGFCTPGFVMSLTALLNKELSNTVLNNYVLNNYVLNINTLNNDTLNNTATENTDESITREKVKHCVAGNLCRCTGYRPIVDAGVKMFELAKQPEPPPLANTQVIENIKMLNAYADKTKLPNHYWQPASLNEVCNLLHAEPQAQIIAGGTDLMLEVTQQFRTLNKLIDISRVAELKQIERHSEKIRIGAAVTYTQLLHEFTELNELQQLIMRIGADQIRNRGTVGGNLANASPIADLPPALLALDADIEIIDGQQRSRTINIDDFYLGYKQTVLNDSPSCITAVNFPQKYLRDFLRFYKISKRIEDDISSVMAAIRFSVADGNFREVRIAYGGMAATPTRAKTAEHCLTGHAIDDQQALQNAINAVQQEFTPLSDVRASANYRLSMAQNLLRKAWLELNGEALPPFTRSPNGNFQPSGKRNGKGGLQEHA